MSHWWVKMIEYFTNTSEFQVSEIQLLHFNNLKMMINWSIEKYFERKTVFTSKNTQLS